jgi:hypothetical protein
VISFNSDEILSSMKVISLLAVAVISAPVAPYYQEYEQVPQQYAYEEGYDAPYVQDQPEYVDQATQYYNRVPQNQKFLHHIRNAWNRVRNFATRNPIARQVTNAVAGKAREAANRGIDKIANSISFYQDDQPQYEDAEDAEYDAQQYEDAEDAAY